MKHFIYYILEGLRRAKVKSLNYSWLTIFPQGKTEPPMTFLEFIKGATLKFTILDPNIVMYGEISRMNSSMQSALDIRRNLQKLMADPNKILFEPVDQTVNAVCYYWDLKKGKKWHHSEILVTMIAPISEKKTPRSCFNCGKPGHYWRKCPQTKGQKSPLEPSIRRVMAIPMTLVLKEVGSADQTSSQGSQCLLYRLLQSGFIPRNLRPLSSWDLRKSISH